jgi:hypothetical protein
MKGKVFYAVFSAAFMAALLIPLLFTDLSGGGVSQRENRMLAERPPFSDAFRHPRGFIRQVDNWFSDNLGFRDSFIRLSKMVERVGVKTRYTDGQYIYLIGEQGHHYFAGVDGIMIEKFQGKPILTDAELLRFTISLREIERYLTAMDIPLVVMLCTDKETIYPEFYPASIRRGPDPSQLYAITEQVRAYTDVDIFHIIDALTAEKDNYLLYDKAEGDLTHYNEIGGFIAYLELMKHINAHFPEIGPFTFDDINIVWDDRGVPATSLKEGIKYDLAGPEFFDNVRLHRPVDGVAFINNDESLPTILFMRDSYAGTGHLLTRYIPQQFGQTILIHWANMAFFTDYIKEFKPDIVIIQAVEREFTWFAACLETTVLP